MLWQIMQCQACLDLILACATNPSGPEICRYQRHYPVGTPNDELSPHIPVEIAASFKEAIRSRWVGALAATVLMCRRALQVSCDREKAQGKDLFKQIDDLVAKQVITAPLSKMAHAIRLLGKQGAHGDYSDIDVTITENDADDAITFMRHYLDHVYVLPAKLVPKGTPIGKS